MTRRLALAAAAAMLACAPAMLRAQAAPTPAETALAAAKSLTCIFNISAKGAWNKEGVPQPTVRKSGTLTINIREINVAAGSALVATTSGNHDVTAQGDGKNLYFIEANRGGRVAITMVIGDYTTGTRLKAGYAIHDYLPIDLGPIFKSEPETTQYYGDCAINP